MLCCLQSDIRSNMRVSKPTDMRKSRWEEQHSLRASDTAAVHMVTQPRPAPVAAAGRKAVAGAVPVLHAVAAECDAHTRQHIKWLIDSSWNSTTAEEPATSPSQKPTTALEVSPGSPQIDHSSDGDGLSEQDVTTTVAAEAPQQPAAQFEPLGGMPCLTEADHTPEGLESGAQPGSSPLDGHANQHSNQPLAVSGVCKGSEQAVTASDANCQQMRASTAWKTAVWGHKQVASLSYRL